MQRDTSLWIRLMLIAVVANGIAVFGLKVVIARQLGVFQPQYLVCFYGGALLLALAGLFSARARPQWRELIIGGVMGLGSVLGSQFMGLALQHGVPGHIVFPVTTGGTLFLVGLVGIVFFRERLGAYGIAGMVLGIASILMLGMA